MVVAATALASACGPGAASLPERQPEPQKSIARQVMSPPSRIAAIQADASSAYDFVRTARGAEGACVACRLRYAIDDATTEVSEVGQPWSFHLHAAAVARGGAVDVPTTRVRIDGNRVVREREDGSDEWFISGPLGIEHGLTVRERPPGNGELIVDIAVDGLWPELATHERHVILRDARGRPALFYGELHVYDARGREIGSRFAVEGSHIELRIDDAGARYPLVVDPLVWIHRGRIVPTDLATGHADFGTSVDADGGTLVVGTHIEPEPGAVYVFRRDDAGNWNQEGPPLQTAEGAGQDTLGIAVAISGDTIVAGAPEYNTDVGAAWVFERDGAGVWTETAKLEGSVSIGSVSDFGYAVAVSGDKILVGAPRTTHGIYTESGAVFVFERSTDPNNPWLSEDMLRVPLLQNDAEYGAGLALEGDRAVVGAPSWEDMNSLAYGEAFVFNRIGPSNWEVETTLEALSQGQTDVDAGFGASVALSGDTVVIGASDADTLTPVRGGFAYTRDQGGTWSLQSVLIHPTDAVDSGFGDDVAIFDDTVVVGAHEEPDAHLFGRSNNSWSATDQLAANSAGSADPVGMTSFYGWSVAADGGAVFVGAPEDGQGSVYVYNLIGSPCVLDTDCGSGICEEGICCDRACDSCEACNLPSQEGTCQVVGEGDTGDPPCSPYLCDGESPTCPTECTDESGNDDDGDCIQGAICQDGSCVKECEDDTVCGGGQCVDGYCCTELCTGQCEACDTPDELGVCVPITGAPHGARDACAVATCVEGAFTPAATCDGSGPECTAPTPTTCAPYGCDEAGCLTTCASTGHCATGFICDGEGVCVDADPLKPSDDGACGCAVPGERAPARPWLAMFGLAMLGLRRRRA